MRVEVFAFALNDEVTAGAGAETPFDFGATDTLFVLTGKGVACVFPCFSTKISYRVVHTFVVCEIRVKAFCAVESVCVSNRNIDLRSRAGINEGQCVYWYLPTR